MVECMRPYGPALGSLARESYSQQEKILYTVDYVCNGREFIREIRIDRDCWVPVRFVEITLHGIGYVSSKPIFLVSQDRENAHSPSRREVIYFF
jgi:hypothetical protein